ncbi:asparagine synthase (glutamine-hydrolyzing) [Streptomyces solicathayae]|uniref:asparagine synthase (glutamine-hydrolyzing) n=1 Tax=Streptomyces solicathayae TaxID=3081768 RepID=A0ABZ0M3H9_9ACTN|nr:asparagine synthase (glutamine-hydrolyzing) [Streptomyces sp. HUAS YS2]WOX26001.1 asparagine synthase (glutamine-hydrolyzing) [Streptomyces sp. HUAS YS2]
MCGIAGITGPGAVGGTSFVADACARMAHRGPDETGLHTGDGAALGMCRLRVVGIHDDGQPVFNADRSVVCVFNGEIYNHAELRRRLERLGHPVGGASDAHVIPALYEALGPDFVGELHGMFAIALYDTRVRRLLLITDRAGKKPLFHSRRPDGSVVFASELPALTACPDLDTEVDPVAVDLYLSHRVVPAPHTVYRHVRKVPPATVLSFEDGRPAEERRYWRYDFTPAETPPWEEAADRVDTLLRTAVADRLGAEVPLGAMLSGGLDSSLVVALAARETRTPLHTFSVGFEQQAFDESAHARTVAEHCGTEHHNYRIGVQDALDAVDRIIRHTGEPYAFPSAIAAYYMYKLAREHVTVTLTGDGSDEIFCGYGRYRVFAGLPAVAPADAHRVDADLLAGGAGDIADRYRAVLVDGLRDGLKGQLYTPEFRDRVAAAGGAANPLRARFADTDANAHELDRVMQLDCGFWLPDAQLVKIDRMAMAHSVEPRSPFLDHRLVEYVTSLSPSLKLVGGDEKAILKHVARRYLPAGIVGRRKQELAVPLEEWLGRHLRPLIETTLLSDASLTRGYFRPDALRRFVTEFRPEHSYALWTLFMLERWHAIGPATSDTDVLTAAGAGLS